MITTNRYFHLVDIDNLLGDPRSTNNERIRDCFEEYRKVTRYRAGSHLAVVGTGCNGCHVVSVQSQWPGVRYVRRPGQDGADIALHEVALDEAVSGRYTHFVIASGDGRFAQTYRQISGLGYPVTVVSRPESLAMELRLLAGKNVLFMPSLSELKPVAA
jgi:uncharacterized LabA/DUF88 family protein